MGTFGLLVALIAAGWRSASMECGEQCVEVTGIVMMPELCADNWGFAQVHRNVSLGNSCCFHPYSFWSI